MRALAFVVGATACVALLHACADYTSDEAPVPAEAGVDASADAPGDAGADATDAGSDGSATGCFDFTAGAAPGFTVMGEVSFGTEGTSILVKSASSPTLVRRTFQASGPVASSRVLVQGSVQLAGSLEGAEFVGLLKVTYGATDQAPRTFLAVTRQGVDVDTWASAGEDPFSSMTLPKETAPLPLDMSTTWSATEGSHTFRAESSKQVINVATATTPSNTITVQVGGSLGSDDTPPLTITLKSLCVELH